MSYYYAKKIKTDFDSAIEATTEALKAEGFGVLTTIDVRATLKEKLDEDFRPYQILGACNPPFAHKALLAEDKIGTMLPCNVIVQQVGDNLVEIAAIDPVASMKSVENDELNGIAEEIQHKLQHAIDSLT